MKPSQKSLKDWTAQKWTTKSGKPSAKTGERYLPEAAIKSLSSAEYAAAGSSPDTPKDKARQKSFKARHAENISKGKMSAAYWADKVKW